jgi:hypothetical protein
MHHLGKETKWLCENAKSLEKKFPGQWVVFSAHEGLVSCGDSLDRVLKTTHSKKNRPASFVFHVPSKEELGPPSLSVSVRQVSR